MSNPNKSLREQLGKILEGVYEQGVVDEHGEVKTGEMVYSELALQPSKALDILYDLILSKQKEARINELNNISNLSNTQEYLDMNKEQRLHNIGVKIHKRIVELSPSTTNKEVFGMKIKTDDRLANNEIRFDHPDGRSEGFKL